KLEGARADDLKAVARGADRFVAAGAQLSVSVIDAPWTVYRTLPVSATAQIHGIAYGAGQFVGVGSRGMIYRSGNGIDWSAVSPAMSADYGALAFGKGYFVAVGQSGLLASADGQAWNQRLTAGLSAVAFGNGLFAALGDKAYRSGDGINWTEHAGPGFRPTALSYGRERFAAVGANVAISFDGLTWQTQAGPGELLQHLAAGSDRFAAIGQSGALFSSADGLTWQKGFQPGTELAGLAYGAGRFLTVSRSGSVYTSTDGVTWSMRPRLQAQAISHIAFAAGQFLAMAPEGTLYTSGDGDSWVKRAAGTAGGLRAAVGGQGRTVALGAEGAILLHMGDFSAPCGARFPDIAATYPACESVERLAARTVVTGYPDGTFRPEQTITRAEFAKLLVLTMGWQAKPGAALPFSDVNGHWAASQGYLQTAYQMGVISGFPDGTFRPDAPISRSQAVKMAATAAGIGQVPAAGYADITAGAWYSGYVGGAQQRNLVGTAAKAPLWDGPVFREAELATRAEASMLLDNLTR
ncbi:MAG TPA: S-layer homology domain-containing protein, partial [Symbiobacteriaceae bacterium]|nr:S-layer homology domain-containing protein [Symbiobacteriaceae bacterium]